jgi:23S rRNA (adenine2503-C2)-methyltransferase
MNLLALTYDQLTAEFRCRYGRGAFHAAALYRAFFRTPQCTPETLPEFRGSPGLARRVNADLDISVPHIVKQVREDDVLKLVLGLADGATVETVVIPMTNHTTVCVSSQVGCRMGCCFCQTGQMGLRRNLSVAEIVAQVYLVSVRLGYAVRNLVFMGMGEPLDNVDALAGAIAVLSDQRGLNIAKRHITVSTAGIAPGITRLAALDWPQLKLAVSLNAPNDTLRNTLMPVNRRYPLDVLKAALETYPLARGNVLFIEYVLIKEVNDAPEHASQLADYLRGLPVRLNLIPYNPRRESPYQAPTSDDVERFRQLLVGQRIFVRLRTSKGAPIQAACGQLGAAC